MSLKHEAALLDTIESQRLGGGTDHKVTNAKREREKKEGKKEREREDRKSEDSNSGNNMVNL